MLTDTQLKNWNLADTLVATRAIVVVDKKTYE